MCLQTIRWGHFVTIYTNKSTKKNPTLWSSTVVFIKKVHIKIILLWNVYYAWQIQFSKIILFVLNLILNMIESLSKMGSPLPKGSAGGWFSRGIKCGGQEPVKLQLLNHIYI